MTARLITINLTEYKMLCDTREEYIRLQTKYLRYENILKSIDGAVDGLDWCEDDGSSIPPKEFRNLCHQFANNAREVLSLNQKS